MKRWLKCGVEAPKVVICDQPLAVLVQSFTEYQTLEKYLGVCFKLIVLKQDIDLPNCYLRNDVNHFIHLVSQWKEVKNSIFNHTKELIIRGMGLLVLCESIDEADKILEAIYIIILSKFDGEVLQTHSESIEIRKTPCAQKKDYLAKLISCNKNQLDLLEQSTIEFSNSEHENNIQFHDSKFYNSLDSFKN